MNCERVDSKGYVWGGWGSSQYDNARKIFLTLRDMNVIEVMNRCWIKFDRAATQEEAMKEFWADEEKDEEDGDERFGQNLTPGECLRYARDQAWDLWSAAPVVAGCFLYNLHYDIPEEFQDSYETTALSCYLLYMFLNVEEDDFKEFDT